MRKKISLFGMLFLSVVLISGCSSSNNTKTTTETQTEAAASETKEKVEEAEESSKETTDTVKSENLEDGVYTVDFNTDNSMFHVNEAYEGKGTLTVENGEMTIHISLPSKNIINLYPGLSEDAQKEGAELLNPTNDTVTYTDGTTEEVNGFDVPVPYLDEEFDLALIGTKGKWYDHKVSVSNPEPAGTESSDDEQSIDLSDGNYTIELTFEGGSGKASITSPTSIRVVDGEALASIEWSSPNYDYMLIDGEKYLPVNSSGNSVFEIPVKSFDKAMNVIGDTVAMSKPHEIEYTITFHSETLKKAE